MMLIDLLDTGCHKPLICKKKKKKKAAPTQTVVTVKLNKMRYDHMNKSRTRYQQFMLIAFI